MRRDTRYNLMAQVEEIESELGRALEERKELMSLDDDDDEEGLLKVFKNSTQVVKYM